jgi:hypothetical protein
MRRLARKLSRRKLKVNFDAAITYLFPISLRSSLSLSYSGHASISMRVDNL